VEAAPIPDNEADRQAALERYDILDTLSEQCYDDITALMSGVCNAPISLVGLIDNDRNWLKSCHGVDLSESPRMISFCGHAIISEEPVFVVPDARKDPRFEDNPLVVEQGVVGYAGAPLIDRDGYALGTLCVFHTEPLDLDKRQLNSLLSMSRQVMRLLESHLRERMLERASDNLASRNEQLKSFVGTVAHDILGPVTSIAALLEIIEEDVDDVELRGDLERVRQSSVTLRGYVDDLLSHYVQGGGEFDSQIGVQLQCLFASLETLVVSDTRVTLVYPDTDITIHTHRSVLFQVLLNLVTNAVKHSLDIGAHVEIGFVEHASCYCFSVSDNGPGIAREQHQSIFELFRTGVPVSSDQEKSTGIGLATVSRLLDQIGGGITLESEIGQGCTFTFTLPKGACDQAAHPRVA
jgi:signal transduction histidine kinase